MAQLKDSIISGNLRVTDSTFTDVLQATTIEAPTTSGGTTYGAGTNGQVLKSNGTTTYWGDIPSYSGMTDSEISAGTGTTDRLITPARLKSAIETYGKGIFVGTCSTTSGPDLIVSTDSKFQLLAGVVIAAALEPIIIADVTTINVNSTGAIPVSIQNSNTAFRGLNRDTYQFFVYNGTSWVWFASNHVPDSIESSTADFDKGNPINDVPRFVSQNDFEDLSNLLTFSGRTISQNGDLNDYTKAGVFRCTTSSVASTLSNTPITGSGFELLVYRNNTSIDNCTQLLISVSTTPKIFCRAKTTLGWTDWGILDPSISGMSTSEIEAGTSTTNRLISPANLKMAIELWADNTTQNGALAQLIDDGSKNILKLTDTATTTKKGVTIRYNNDGTYTVDSAGSPSTGDDFFYLARTSENPVFPANSVISGCTGGTDSTYRLQIAATTIYQSNNPITLTEDTSGSLIFYFASGQTFNNMVLSPMVCSKFYYDLTTTFEPYRYSLITDYLHKNLIGSSYLSGTAYADMTCVAPAGKYMLCFTSVTSTDTDATTCRVEFFNSNQSSVLSSITYVQRSSSFQAIPVTLTGESCVFRVYASTDYQKSSGDTVTIYGAMLCKKEDYETTSKFIEPKNTINPYKNVLVPMTNVSRTVNGITVRGDGMGGYVVSGTASAQAVFTLGVCNMKAGVKYVITGIHGGSTNTYFLNMDRQISGTSANINIYESPFYHTSDKDGGTAIRFYVRSGVNTGSGTLRIVPMVCEAGDYDIDTVFQRYEPIPTNSYYGRPKLIYDIDLNDLRQTGVYCVQNSTVAAKIKCGGSYSGNPHTTSAFMVEVFDVGTLIQRLSPVSSASSGFFYQRGMTSSTWGSWYKFNGTQV